MNRLRLHQQMMQNKNTRRRFWKAKWFWSVLITGLNLFLLALALIPTWIFFLVRNVASPEGFWQEVVLFGIGLYVLGGIQVFLLAIYVVWLVYYFTEM